MTTATQPQRPAHVPAEAQFNGEKWFTFDATAGKWVEVPEAAAPAVPPLPAPSGNGQATDQKAERPPVINPDHLADFFNQRSFAGGEGKTWKFHQMPEGTQYEGIVARNTTRFDVVAQTKPGTGEYVMQNGNYKWQLQVPMLMMPGGLYPDGKAVAIFKVGDARDKLSAAMQHSGAPLTKDRLEDGTEVEGYLPAEGDYIRMTKIKDQPGRNANGEGFTRYIYDVIHRCGTDPFAAEFRAKVMAAHQALEDAGPPPSAPEPGAPPQAYIDYANALAAYQTRLGGTPATNGTTPAVPAPSTPPALPAPSTAPAAATPATMPPVPPPGAAAVQAAAAQVATADNGLPPTTMPTPVALPPVPPPAAAGPQNTPAAPASTSAPATAPAPAAPATITSAQWQQMQPPVRKVVSAQTGIAIPPDLDPDSPSYAGQ
jgi:hypothetical protein